MRIALYLRYSSHNQDEFSIEGQRQECQIFAEKNNYTIVAEYCDRAKSGTKDDRKEFLKMIEDSKKGLFDSILVYKLDRFARNRYDSVMYKQQLKKLNIRVLSAIENLSDGKESVILESVLEGMAEYFSLNLGENVKRGMSVNADNCYYNGGTVPVGLKLKTIEIPNPANASKPIIKKRYVIDEEKAPFIEKIFQMYIERNTMASIINYLNRMGVKTANNKEFNRSSIRRILTNKKYVGVYSYNGVETKEGIPRIVSDEIFQKAQEELARNGLAPARNRAKTEYLLTTKLYCGECKGKMTGKSGTSKTGKLHTYYKCVGANNKVRLCDNKMSLRKDFIEDLVIKEAQKFLSTDNLDFVANEIARISRNEQDNTQIKHLEKAIREAEKKKANTLKAIIQCENNDTIRKMLYDELMKTDTDKAKFEQELIKEKSSHIIVTANEVKFFFRKLKRGSISDEKYRKMLVNTLINRVYVYYNKIVVVLNVGENEKEVEIDLFTKGEGSPFGSNTLPI